MIPNLIVLAIPAFLLLIGGEWAIARARGLSVYRWADLMSNIGCGLIEQTLSTLLILGATLRIYSYLLDHFAMVSLSEKNWATWLLGFLAVDFVFYVWHRLSHEVTFLWNGHVLHHQSEEYNLSVGLRQGFWAAITVRAFYLPLAFLGLPLRVVAVLAAADHLYQYWLHTRLVGKMPWFERFFNAPSLHRVHHGTNPEYLDKNYGAVLMVWDRLFGTYQSETEPVRYGTTSPLRSWSPIEANIEPWRVLRDKLRATSSLRDGLRVWTGPPG